MALTLPTAHCPLPTAHCPLLMARELILLSPYTPPTQHALMLGEDDTACWLNAWSALWHPAALRGAAGPPRWVGPYDHDAPAAGQVFALPQSPALYLPDDWEDRARQAGAAVFRATPDRAETLANLRAALEGETVISDQSSVISDE